jgi:hypothetical protein
MVDVKIDTINVDINIGEPVSPQKSRVLIRGGIEVQAKFVQRSLLGDVTVRLTSKERERLLALLTDIEARVAREMEGQAD